MTATQYKNTIIIMDNIRNHLILDKPKIVVLVTVNDSQLELIVALLVYLDISYVVYISYIILLAGEFDDILINRRSI